MKTRAGVGTMGTKALAVVMVSAAATAAWCPPVHAGPLEDAVASAVEGLAASSDEAIQESVRKLAALDDPRGIPALDALCDDRLRVGADGHPYIWDSKTRDVRHPAGADPGARSRLPVTRSADDLPERAALSESGALQAFRIRWSRTAT